MATSLQCKYNSIISYMGGKEKFHSIKTKLLRRQLSFGNSDGSEIIMVVQFPPRSVFEAQVYSSQGWCKLPCCLAKGKPGYDRCFGPCTRIP